MIVVNCLNQSSYYVQQWATDLRGAVNELWPSCDWGGGDAAEHERSPPPFLLSNILRQYAYVCWLLKAQSLVHVLFSHYPSLVKWSRELPTDIEPRDPSSHSTTWLPVNSRLPVPVRSWNVSVGRFIYADCASFRAYILLRHINLLRMNCVSILFDLWNKSKDGAVADEVLTTGLWKHSLLAIGGYWDVELTLGFIRRRYGGFLLAQYNHCVRRDVTENAVDVQ